MSDTKTVYYKDINELTDAQQLEQLEQEISEYTDEEINFGSELLNKIHEQEKEYKNDQETGNAEQNIDKEPENIINNVLTEETENRQTDRKYLEKCIQAKNQWDFYSDFYKEIYGVRPTKLPKNENHTKYIKLKENEGNPHYDERLGKFKAEINTSGMTAKNGWELDMYIQAFDKNHPKGAKKYACKSTSLEDKLNYFAQVMRGEWKYEKKMTGNDKIPSGTYEVREFARRTSGVKPSEELKARKQNLTKREEKWYEQYADGNKSLTEQVKEYRKQEEEKHTNKDFPDRFCVQIKNLTKVPNVKTKTKKASKKKQRQGASEKTVPTEFENMTEEHGKNIETELEAGA